MRFDALRHIYIAPVFLSDRKYTGRFQHAVPVRQIFRTVVDIHPNADTFAASQRLENTPAAGRLQHLRIALLMLNQCCSRALTHASIFDLAWGTWAGWSHIARDRELRFESYELPPPPA